MSLVLRWLGWRGILAVILLSLLLAQTLRLSWSTHAVESLTAQQTTWSYAQQTNMDTIGTLQSRLTALAESRRLERARMTAAVTAAERSAQDAQDALRRRNATRDTIYATEPDAATWGRAGVPVSVLGSLPPGDSHQDR